MRWIAFFTLVLALVSWMDKKPTRSAQARTAAATVHLNANPDTLIMDDLVFADFFSPNDDGHNDTYIILNVENYENNSLKIFNRWGEVVYLSSPYQNDWNGTNNQGSGVLGKKLSDGVYYFEFYNGKGNKATGKITLKR